jgi:RNA polymerase sigma factor (sigma-70 family)
VTIALPRAIGFSLGHMAGDGATAGGAGVFEGQRRRLFGLAYRLLGSAADAEDIVQDAFLRWEAAGQQEIGNPAAWLTRAVTNLCLTELASARQRRERYAGTWLPEPVLTGGGDLGPLETAEQRESVSMALLLILENLTPPERAVFVLHEAFGYRYAEIGAILGRSEAACRQLAHRAAGRVREARHAARVSARAAAPGTAESARPLIERFLAAAGAGDVAGLEELLAEDVVSWSDGGGKFPAGMRPVYGHAKVIRLLASLGPALLGGAPATGAARAYAGVREAGIEFTRAEVNGAPAMLAWSGGRLFAVVIPEFGPAGITALYSVVNPGKLAFAAKAAAR